MADAPEIKIYDISQPEPVLGTIHPDEVQAAVSSGKYSLPKGDVKVVDPSGALGTIDAHEAPQAFQQGYSYATPHLEKQIKFGSGTEQFKAGLEGVAEGVIGPLAPMIERTTGANPEDIRARAEVNPGTKMIGQAVGLGAGLLTGTGEGALLEMAGKGAAEALGLGKAGAGVLNKIGAHSIQSATEMALLSGGDETSKMILNDPHQSLQSAITDVGLSSFIGAGGGAALGSISPLWKATVGDRAAQFVEDFKGRLNEHLANPDPLGAVTDELSNYHKSITGLNDEVWGQTGIKAQAIDRVMPEMNEKILGATNELADKLNSRVLEMKSSPDVYPPRLVGQYEQQVNRILEAVTDPNSTPGKIFDAVQTTKQWAQDSTKSMWKYGSFDPEYQFAQKVTGLSKELRPFLEDPKVWGEVGKLQQDLNSAASKWFPSLKDFESKFTAKIGNERVVDPGKIATYMNQLGKPNAELKQEMLDRFLKSSEKYRGEVSGAYSRLGMESPFEHSSLNQANQTLSKLSPGAKAADVLVKKGLANIAGKGLGSAIGAGAGALAGHPWVGGIVGEHALGPFFSSILPSIVKPLMSKSASGEGLKAAAEYGLAISRGNKMIEKATKALFIPGSEVLAPKALLSDKQRDKLDEHLKDLSKDPSKLFAVGGKSAYYMPDHAGAMGETAGRVVEYLNSLRPQQQKLGPLDPELKPSKPEMAKYHRALEIAEQPLVVMGAVKEGTITQQDVMHLKAMYPALYDKMAMGIHNEISNHVEKGNDIPYKTRLGMSLFLGEPLDSTMTQGAIMNTQLAISANPMQQQQPMPQPKRSMNSMNKMSSLYQTPQQSRVQSKGSP